MVGLDVSDRSIKVVEITGGNTPTLRTVCWSSLAPNVMRRGLILDPVVAADNIKEAMLKCSPARITDRTVVVSIPESQSFVRVIELPKMSDREMDEAVQWAIRHHMPFDLERMYLDWQILAPGRGDAVGRVQVLVGAAQRDVVDPLLQVLDASGLQVVALELEAQAIVRSLLPTDAADVSGVLIVDLGATSTNVIFFDQGAMRFTTSVQRGGDDLTQQLAQQLQLQPSVAAEKKALVGVQTDSSDPKVAEALRPITLDLVRQINQVVQGIMPQVNASLQLKAVLLAGGAANLPGIVNVFAEIFPGIPVQLGNPLVNLQTDEKSGASVLSSADASHFTTAIGLALRQADNN